jgi:hypothetical protein
MAILHALDHSITVMPKCNEIAGKFFSRRNDMSHVIPIGLLTIDVILTALSRVPTAQIPELASKPYPLLPLVSRMASEPNGRYESTSLTFSSDSDEDNIPELPSDDSMDDEIKQASVESMLTSPQIASK